MNRQEFMSIARLLIVKFDEIRSGTMERSIHTAQEGKDRFAAGLHGSPVEDVLDYAVRGGWKG